MNEDSRRAWVADVLALIATAGGLWACADVPGAREIAAAILAAQVLSSFGGRIWGTYVIVMAVVIAAVAVVGGHEVGVLVMLGGLAAHRRAFWASATDDRLSLAFALLFVLFGILEGNPGLWRGAALVAATGPWLLGAPSWRTLPVVLLSGLLGLFLPSSPRQPDLRAAPALADLRPPGGPDDRAVVRIYAADLQPPLYLRAAALDHFDGLVWTRTVPVPTWPILDDAGSSPIIIERGASPDGWLLGLGGVSGIVPLMGPFTRLEGQIRVDGSPDRVRYAVVASPPWEQAYDAAPPDDRYLQVPDGLRSLSASSASFVRADRAEMIRAMVGGLRRDHAYTLSPAPIAADQPLRVFIEEDRPGHCEYFASALATWLRLEGVPSRLITGFVGGHLEDGVLVYPADAAHVWVEAIVDGRWVPVDPTPGAPFDPAIAPSDGTVATFLPLGTIPRGAPWAMLVVALAILGASPWFLRWRVPGTVAGLHASAERHMRENGWDLPRDLPPVATAEWVRARIGDDAEPLVTLAWLHYRVRYGEEEPAPLLPLARAAWAAAVRLRPPPM